MIQLPNLKDTIVALSTAPGMAAIAVIRMSGLDTMTIANRIFHGKNLESVPSHSIHFGSIRDGKKIIDEVLISVFRAPNSFTKEDVVEISCHGSVFIQEQILKLCVQEGARMATPGEFSMRAFLHGQMDLSQAEAIADLIAANSKASHDLAMKQMRGGISKQIQNMRSQLVDLASLVELELDFSEEDVEFADRTELRNLVNKIHQHIVSLIQSFELGNAIKNGIPTVIAGRPNAGKSTLLNALLNEDRAIVSDIAGTTRDTIEEILNIQGVEFRLIDTAGIRAAQDLIESMGVEKTMEKIKDSSLIVYVFDVIETDKVAVQEDIQKLQKENGQLLIVANKMDLNPYIKAEDYYDHNINAENLITASAINQMNIEYLKEKLFEVALGSSDQQSHIAISNNRHLQSFVKTQESLEEIMQAMDAGLTSDLLAFNIRNALHYLGEVTGEVSTDDLLGNIFGKFCIGK